MFYEPELVGLAESGAKYLVIGGVAVVTHGFPRLTLDLDILPDLNAQNLDRIIHALQTKKYQPIVPVDPNELKDPAKREFWRLQKNMRVFSFIQQTDPTKIVDIMIYHQLNFEECFARRTTIHVQGREVFVASIDDLIVLKKETMRDKDRLDIAYLERLRAQRQQS